ncbi:hypothetical protein ACXWTF_12885 [Thiomicrolovo sp. ZZH C-3]
MLRDQKFLESDALQFLEVKPFKIKAAKIEFAEAEFLSAKEKGLIYRKWVSFLNSHFKQSNFTKKVYEHLHLHCGYIAHYNINGFYENYFTDLQEECKCFDTDDLHTKRYFYDVYRSMFNSSGPDFGLHGFLENWTGRGFMGARFDGDYGDVNTAMRDALLDYMIQYELLIDAANTKLEKARQSERVKLKVQQRDRLKAVIANVQNELDQLEKEMIDEVGNAAKAPKGAPAALTLFDVA